MARHTALQGSASAEGLTRGDWIAFGLCIVWMLFAAVYFWMAPPVDPVAGQAGRLEWLLILVVVFIPVGLVWVAVAAARSARIVRAETFRLQTALDDLRQMQLAQAASLQRVEPVVERRLDAIAESTQKTEAAVADFASRREVSRLIVPRVSPQAQADQPALALGAAEDEDDANPPLARTDLVRALNFPDDEHDKDGFAALRRALRDRKARHLVRASQDVLTLLSQDGIYTDDLQVDPHPADLWRRFAKGERGPSIGQLGAIHDHAHLARTAARMREDTIFRDAVHHFLRRFDEMLVTFEENATDTDLLAFAETRTARAFMLLARTTGTFD